jgi:hypothetical protein
MNILIGIMVTALIVVGVLCLVAGIILAVNGPHWPRGLLNSKRIAETVRAAAFRGDVRFKDVTIEYAGGSLNLNGRTKTGEEKWEARNLVWMKGVPALKGMKIEAVFNSILSDEPDPMPATPNTLEDSAFAWKEFQGIRRPR